MACSLRAASGLHVVVTHQADAEEEEGQYDAIEVEVEEGTHGCLEADDPVADGHADEHDDEQAW